MPIRRTLVVVGLLVGVVGLALGSQAPQSNAVVAAVGAPLAGSEATDGSCKIGQDTASAVIVPALIEPEGKKPYWGYRIDAKLICVKHTGTIVWFVDATEYPPGYTDGDKAKKFKLQNFKLKDKNVDKDPFGGKCGEIEEIKKNDGTGINVFVTKCKLDGAHPGEDYTYEILPSKNGNGLPFVDPEIQVRG